MAQGVFAALGPALRLVVFTVAAASQRLQCLCCCLGLFSSHFGLIPPGVDVASPNARTGDQIILSGTIADHGITVLTRREGLSFKSGLCSDSPPLNQLVNQMFDTIRLFNGEDIGLERIQELMSIKNNLDMFSDTPYVSDEDVTITELCSKTETTRDVFV